MGETHELQRAVASISNLPGGSKKEDFDGLAGFHMAFKVSNRFPGLSWFPRVFRDFRVSRGFQGLPWSSMFLGFSEFSRVSTVSGSSKDFQDFQGVPGVSRFSGSGAGILMVLQGL